MLFVDKIGRLAENWREEEEDNEKWKSKVKHNFERHNSRKLVCVKYWQFSSVPSDRRKSMILLGRDCAWGSLNRFEL